MPYKRTPSTCPVCDQPFMQRPGVPTCSPVCGYKYIRQRTDTAVANRVVRGTDPDGCWVYTGNTNAAGYGFLHRRNEESFMHRRAWTEATGELLTEADVIGHICDNRPCIRNDSVGTYELQGDVLPRRGHLFKGTHTHNHADMVSKGRNNRGERHHWHTRPELTRRGEAATGAKLTSALVREIRARFASGGIRQRRLAVEYGVSPMTISRIVRRKLWDHVD